MQLATMPLDHVPVVSLDLETTGLRARSDRIVQIGAIRSHDATAPFAVLVRPGIPIPAASTRIHRIDDAMVAGADTLPMVLPRLRRRSAGISYSATISASTWLFWKPRPNVTVSNGAGARRSAFASWPPACSALKPR